MADDARRLIELQPGEAFQAAIFAASNLTLRQTRGGDPYLQLKLCDCTGERSAKLWNAPHDILESLKAARLVKVSGFVERGGRYDGEIRLNHIALCPAPDDLTPYLMPLPGDHAAHRARFSEIIRAVANPYLKALLKEIFQASDLMTRFCEAPAARKMHHAYRGGLLEHTGEVALMCERIACTLPHLNRDLLLTAALLHDIGKLEEMEQDLNAGEYTPAGHLVGHVVLGTCLVAGAAEKVPDFPPRLKHELMHLILSHHGEPEYGAARRPICAEALVLSQCDLMSAKIAQCHEAASRPDASPFPASKGWHAAPLSSQDSIYVGLMRDLMEPDE